MDRKDHIDAFGAVSLIGFSALLGFNQVVIKITNDGLQPVFQAGLRSLGAMCLLYLWMKFRRQPIVIEPFSVPWGLLTGTLFASEFVLLFLALDVTTVARSSLMFYTMPVWLSLMAHVAIPAERLTVPRVVGLALAVSGVALALLTRDEGPGDIRGDMMALAGSLGWAGIALVAKATSFNRVRPMMQIYWQLSVSAVILLGLSGLFGPLVRDFAPLHAATMSFQVVVMGACGYLFWFWLLKHYPSANVASFGFLAPIFGVGFGWLVLGEEIGAGLVAALVLVCAGLLLINRPARRAIPA